MKGLNLNGIIKPPCGVSSLNEVLLRVIRDGERAFMERSKSLFTNDPNPRKWWPTVKTAVFDASLHLPPW